MYHTCIKIEIWEITIWAQMRFSFIYWTTFCNTVKRRPNIGKYSTAGEWDYGLKWRIDLSTKEPRSEDKFGFSTNTVFIEENDFALAL